MKNPISILITGASSGIGAALARAYAGEKTALFLSGRDEKRLTDIAETCQSLGATVKTIAIDVADREKMRQWIEQSDDEAPLDLVIANAGMSSGSGGKLGETETQARRIFSVNLDGVLNTAFPAVERMRPRGSGQIALMSSIAAFRGFAGAPAYSASKAAVRIFAEAMRGELHDNGIGVSVICPGFVESRMTATNKYPMPFLMSAERAAEIIRHGLARNRSRIAFPFPTYFLAWFMGTLPPALTDPLFRRLPKKE